MNILDIKIDELPPIPLTSTWIDSIFDTQEALHAKYQPIEEASGIGLNLLKNVPWSIDNKFCQYILKDYAWRVTEELAESNTAHSSAHVIEELIDALHFYTELLIIARLRKQAVEAVLASYDADPPEPDEYHEPEPIDIINELGCAMNTLKQKPWKQHHFATDAAVFKAYIISGYLYLLRVIGEHGLSTRDIHAVYHQKSLVNNFRIRSNY